MKDRTSLGEKLLQFANVTTSNSYKFYVEWIILAFRLTSSCISLPFCCENGLEYKNLTVCEKALNYLWVEYGSMNYCHLVPGGFRGLWSWLNLNCKLLDKYSLVGTVKISID